MAFFWPLRALLIVRDAGRPDPGGGIPKEKDAPPWAGCGTIRRQQRHGPFYKPRAGDVSAGRGRTKTVYSFARTSRPGPLDGVGGRGRSQGTTVLLSPFPPVDQAAKPEEEEASGFFYNKFALAQTQAPAPVLERVRGRGPGRPGKRQRRGQAQQPEPSGRKLTALIRPFRGHRAWRGLDGAGGCPGRVAPDPPSQRGEQATGAGRQAGKNQERGRRPNEERTGPHGGRRANQAGGAGSVAQGIPPPRPGREVRKELRASLWGVGGGTKAHLCADCRRGGPFLVAGWWDCWRPATTPDRRPNKTSPPNRNQYAGSPLPFPPCLVLIFRLVGGKERGEKSTRKGGKGRGRRRQREPSRISFGLTKLRLAAHGADRRFGRVAPRMVSGAAARRSGGERSEPERLLDFDQAGNRRRSSEQSPGACRRRLYGWRRWHSARRRER